MKVFGVANVLELAFGFMKCLIRSLIQRYGKKCCCSFAQGLYGVSRRASQDRAWLLNLGHFQVGSYRYSSLTEGLSLYTL